MTTALATLTTKLAAKLAAAQKAGPRLLTALKIAVAYMPQGAEQDGFADLITEVEGAAS